MICYKCEGYGLPLLMIHGFGISQVIWEELIPLLRPHFQLIMIELPGIGNSPYPDFRKSYYDASVCEIEQLRQILGFEYWNVCSYSIGTHIAELYLQTYANHVNKAIFISPLFVPGWRWYSIKAYALLDDLCPSLGDWFLSSWRLRSFVWLLGFSGHSHSSIPRWIDEINQQNISSLKISLRDLPSTGRQMFDLQVPALFICGDSDIVVAKTHRHDRCIRINTAHSAPVLAASDIAQIMLTYLREERTPI